MILITLGTQDKNFTRVLQKVDELIEKGVIKEEVIVQAGYTKYESKNMKTFDYVSQEELSEYMNKCRFLITHAGVGSILSGLEKDKKIIAVPRLKEYKEHTNNHQIEIGKSFSEQGYILYVEDMADLEKEILNIDQFKPRKLEHNNRIIETIEEFIDNI